MQASVLFASLAEDAPGALREEALAAMPRGALSPGRERSLQPSCASFETAGRDQGRRGPAQSPLTADAPMTLSPETRSRAKRPESQHGEFARGPPDITGPRRPNAPPARPQSLPRLLHPRLALAAGIELRGLVEARLAGGPVLQGAARFRLVALHLRPRVVGGARVRDDVRALRRLDDQEQREARRREEPDGPPWPADRSEERDRSDLRGRRGRRTESGSTGKGAPPTAREPPAGGLLRTSLGRGANGGPALGSCAARASALARRSSALHSVPGCSRSPGVRRFLPELGLQLVVAEVRDAIVVVLVEELLDVPPSAGVVGLVGGAHGVSSSRWILARSRRAFIRRSSLASHSSRTMRAWYASRLRAAWISASLRRRSAPLPRTTRGPPSWRSRRAAFARGSSPQPRKHALPEHPQDRRASACDGARRRPRVIVRAGLLSDAPVEDLGLRAGACVVAGTGPAS